MPNDIEEATKLARAMITHERYFRYGCNGNRCKPVSGRRFFPFLLTRDADQIDTLTVDLVKAQHQKVDPASQDNLPKLHEIAKYLYEHETITGEEFMAILMRKPELAAADSAAFGN